MPSIDDYAKNTGFGGATGRTKFEDDGTAVFSGDATVWDDITGSLVGRTLSSVVGGVQYDWDENTVVFNSNGDIATTADRIGFNIQVPHAAIVDGTIDLHMHWEQIDAVAREFTVKHRIQNNGDAKNTTWVTTVIATGTDQKFTWVSGTLNQLDDLVDIDMTSIGISSVIQFQIARTDSVAGDIAVTFVDVHVEKDTLGSREEYVK